MRKIGFIILVLMAGLWACEYETIVPIVVVVEDDISFSEKVAPIFDEVGCTSCHGGGISPNLKPADSWLALTNGGYINTEDPEDSELMEKIEAGHGTSGNLTAEQKALILKWITEGAKNN